MMVDCVMEVFIHQSPVCRVSRQQADDAGFYAGAMIIFMQAPTFTTNTQYSNASIITISRIELTPALGCYDW